MKKCLLSLFCLCLFLYAKAQGGFSNMLFPVSFNITPVADSEVEAIGINNGTKNVIPYDFYAAFNCEVNHTLDSVFYTRGDSILLIAESTVPCRIIIYGKNYYNQNDGYNIFHINSYSNGKYRDTIAVGNIYDGLHRIIVTGENGIFKKSVKRNNPIHPFLSSNPGINEYYGNSVIQGLDPIPIATPFCSVDIYDVYEGLVNHVEGEVAKNIYLLSGNVPLSPQYNFYDAVLPDTAYTVFTTNSTTDVEMFLLGQNDSLIAHCDSYTAQSLYNWGTDPRVNMQGTENLKAVILIPHRTYLDQRDDYEIEGDDYVFTDTIPEGTTDLYLGCKYYNFRYGPDHGNTFPNLLDADAILSDPQRYTGIGVDYNCFAWALGYYSYYFHRNYGGVTTVNGLISYYNNEGYTTNGATEANSEIDIWEHNNICTHASVRSYTNGRSYGYDWESKDGFHGRFMHPRYALENDGNEYDDAYGHVVAYMIKNPEYVSREVIIENVEFSDEELETIGDMVSRSANAEEKAFEGTYTAMMREIKGSHVSNPALFYRVSDKYRKVVELCVNSPHAQGYVMRELSHGDIIAAYVLLDVRRLDSQAEKRMEQVRIPELQIDEATQRIVRPDLSEATLYAKSLLLERGEAKSYDSFANDVRYSNNEDAFSVKTNGRQFEIDLLLDHVSTVSLVVSRYGTTTSQIILNQKSLNVGNFHYAVDVKEAGIYTISYIENGHLFCKKISVE